MQWCTTFNRVNLKVRWTGLIQLECFSTIYRFVLSVVVNSLRWNKTGITVAGASAGTAGVAANLLTTPYGLAFDTSKALYIADYSNHRVQKWWLNASSGTTVAGRADGVSGATATSLNSPGFVLIDSNNNIFLADRLNHRVMWWGNGAASGTTIAGVTGKHRCTDTGYC